MARKRDYYWREVVAAQEKSGLSAVDYCKQHDISVDSFYARKSGIKKKQRDADGNGFVTLKPEKNLGEASCVSLNIGAVSIQCTASLSPVWIAQLIKALS